MVDRDSDPEPKPLPQSGGDRRNSGAADPRGGAGRAEQVVKVKVEVEVAPEEAREEEVWEKENNRKEK